MAAAKGTTLQDTYLNFLRKEKMPVMIYLVNGVKLKGVIKGFDSFVIILKDIKQQLIYKHSISSIVPEGEVNLRDEEIAET
ncbi:RNA chaperone Hfq [Candidatus Magnetominusculus xianensis]|uniref:RNA-binding protein Hfq n=1 Tax=Candidatus Magnetominusculus xianensis TaxID=1748249 RepID=A0ABR5SN70_9BACT|nr:RNA chaperone Hfq [Candidatus Magnetominusculus xianensis]KWT92834.1 RNA-binding protein hfq [Candidatus Magnetominusculus xianensis]MBF0403423.1 RNA chaperone Hfq [Nitrospirota bacterium]